MRATAPAASSPVSTSPLLDGGHQHLADDRPRAGTRCRWSAGRTARCPPTATEKMRGSSRMACPSTRSPVRSTSLLVLVATAPPGITRVSCQRSPYPYRSNCPRHPGFPCGRRHIDSRLAARCRLRSRYDPVRPIRTRGRSPTSWRPSDLTSPPCARAGPRATWPPTWSYASAGPTRRRASCSRRCATGASGCECDTAPHAVRRAGRPGPRRALVEPGQQPAGRRDEQHAGVLHPPRGRPAGAAGLAAARAAPGHGAVAVTRMPGVARLALRRLRGDDPRPGARIRRGSRPAPAARGCAWSAPPGELVLFLSGRQRASRVAGRRPDELVDKLRDGPAGHLTARPRHRRTRHRPD